MFDNRAGPINDYQSPPDKAPIFTESGYDHLRHSVHKGVCALSGSVTANLGCVLGPNRKAKVVIGINTKAVIK